MRSIISYRQEMPDSKKPHDELDATHGDNAGGDAPKFYPVAFATPGRRTPEIRAEDLAISEVESFICSILTLVTGMDIEEVAGMRRDRLGERAGAVAAARGASPSSSRASGPGACGRLVRDAYLWLQSAKLTMRADDFARASSLAAAAMRSGGDDSDHAEALLARAKVATAQSEIRADLVAGERAVLAAPRAALLAGRLNNGGKEEACLAYDALLTSARASISEAARANTVAANHRKFAAEMKHAGSLLEIGPDLVAGLPMDDRPDLPIEFALLRGRFEELVHLSDTGPGWTRLDRAIESSREAVRLVLASGNGLFLADASLQLWRQLRRRWPDPPEQIASEVRNALVNGLLNSSPMSRTSFELLLAWAELFYVVGHLEGDERRSAFGAAIWQKCGERLRERNPALCFQAAEEWGRNTELVAGQAKAAVPYELAADAAKELSRRPGLEGQIAHWLAEMSDVQAFGTAALGAAGRLVRAAEVAESGRSVLQQVDLCLPDELAALGAAGHGRLGRVYSRAWSAQRLVVSEMEQMPQPATWDLSEHHYSLLEAANHRLEAATEAIRRQPGFGGFPQSPPFRQLREAADDAPLAYVAAGLSGGVALLVRASSDEAPERILLPELTHKAVNEHAFGLRNAFRSVAGPFGPGGWGERLDSVGEWLWDALVGRLLEATDGAPWIRLIPLGLTTLLPIHTAWTRSGGGRVFAIDSTALSYLPSARLRLHARTRPVGDRWTGLLAEGDDLDSVASAVEMRGARRQVPDHVTLRGAEATPAAFMKEIGNCNFAHVSAHGFVDERKPVESGFHLSGDKIVRIKQLRALRLAKLELLVLSSCESAMAATAIPDETYGLAGLFYGTSATAVIAAQWQVDQFATAALFDAFYEHWDGSHLPGEIAEALRRAQIAVRDGGRAHPLWWGGFTLTG
jgi:hypothetical protein